MANTIAVLRDFLVNHSNQPIDADELDGSSDLLEEGVLDSLSLMVLVEFLTERYSIEFDADEVIPRNFKSLEAIATLVDGKVEGKG
jgi:acyl carrier protein